jgi:hypothetical protein
MVGNMAHALTFTATSPGDATNKMLSASVTFTVTNLQLVITLSNTADFDPTDSADILTGVFFKLAGDPLLTAASAVLGADTAIKGRPGVSGPGMNVGGEWAYRNNLTGPTTNEANEGISSTTLKVFNQHFRFPGSNLQGPSAPGKVQFGVTTDFDNLGNDKGALKHQQLIENTVVFTLTGLSTNFTLANISNVSFQYGTSLTDGNIAGTVSGGGSPIIPEPDTVVLVAAGLFGSICLGAITRGRRPQSRALQGLRKKHFE